MNYAVVENGVVTNIISALPYSGIPNLVLCEGIPVHVGDTYADGVFYRDGKRVRPLVDEMFEALLIMGVAE